jgi:Na+/phosphate symporter
MPEPTFELATMITGLGGGLALFLYGMRKMTEALKTVAGPGLKDVLAKLTTNRFTGALPGALITAVIQSSSVTTVMVVGFVSAGLLTFTQSIGVIMGANIGTTMTAQIIAFNITEYSLAMIGAGFLTELLAKRQRTRNYGIALRDLVEPLPRRVQEYFAVANYLENVGDTVETGFVTLGYRRMEAGVEFAAQTTARLEELANEATGLFVQATTAFAERDPEAAQRVVESDDSFNRNVTQAHNQIVTLLAEGSGEGLARYRLAIELVNGLKRVQTLSRRIAGALLDAHRTEEPTLPAGPEQSP